MFVCHCPLNIVSLRVECNWTVLYSTVIERLCCKVDSILYSTVQRLECMVWEHIWWSVPTSSEIIWGHPAICIWVTHYTERRTLHPGGRTQRGGPLHPGVREDTPHRGRSNRRRQLGFTRGGDKTPVDYNIYCKRLTVSGYWLSVDIRQLGWKHWGGSGLGAGEVFKLTVSVRHWQAEDYPRTPIGLP